MSPKQVFVRFKLKIYGYCPHGGSYKATCEVSYKPKPPCFIDVVTILEETRKAMPALAEETALQIYNMMAEFCQESGGTLGFIKLKVKEADNHGPIVVDIYP